jgi:hypothetical protein
MTDGRHVLLGCVNTTSSYTGCTPGHLDADIRSAAFSFAPGELVTALTLWAGPDNKGTPNARAGALRFATSLVRLPAPSPTCRSNRGRLHCLLRWAAGIDTRCGRPERLRAHACSEYALLVPLHRRMRSPSKRLMAEWDAGAHF